jgi:hypothetical protein
MGEDVEDEEEDEDNDGGGDVAAPPTTAPSPVLAHPTVATPEEIVVEEDPVEMVCHTRFLCLNQVLIICMSRINWSTHMDQKYSRIAKCHE